MNAITKKSRLLYKISSGKYNISANSKQFKKGD